MTLNREFSRILAIPLIRFTDRDRSAATRVRFSAIAKTELGQLPWPDSLTSKETPRIHGSSFRHCNHDDGKSKHRGKAKRHLESHGQTGHFLLRLGFVVAIARAQVLKLLLLLRCARLLRSRMAMTHSQYTARRSRAGAHADALEP